MVARITVLRSITYELLNIIINLFSRINLYQFVFNSDNV